MVGYAGGELPLASKTSGVDEEEHSRTEGENYRFFYEKTVVRAMNLARYSPDGGTYFRFARGATAPSLVQSHRLAYGEAENLVKETRVLTTSNRSLWRASR